MIIYKWYTCSVWFVDIRICDQANKNEPCWHKNTPNQTMLNIFELPCGKISEWE